MGVEEGVNLSGVSVAVVVNYNAGTLLSESVRACLRPRCRPQAVPKHAG